MLALALPVTVVSCGSVPIGPQVVLVSQDELLDGTIMTPGPGQQAAPIEVAKLPEDMRKVAEKLYPGVPVLVMTTIDHVKPASTEHVPNVIPFTPPANEEGKADFGAWLGQAWPALQGLLPESVAGWGPLAGLLVALLTAKRSRSHLADSAKKAVTLDVKGSLSSLNKAVGRGHTLNSPEELRAIADKLEMEAEMDEKLKNK